MTQQIRFTGTLFVILAGVAACQPNAQHSTAQWHEFSIAPQIRPSIVEQRHSVYFETDEDRLTERERLSLLAFASGLDQSASIRIRVDGHADMRGTSEYNLDLSLRRADNVSKLLQTAGLRRLNFDVGGLGEEDPAAFGTNAESLALNRRVELVAETVAIDIDGCANNDVDLSNNPSNVRDYQMGCSNLSNLVGMVADRRDLAGSRNTANTTLAVPDPVAQYGAVDRYRKHEIPELPDNGGS